MGFALAGISKNEDQVAPLANLITLPMTLLSGVFFSRTHLPRVVHAITDLFPLTFLADVFEHAFDFGFPGTAPSTLRPEMDGVYLSQLGDGMLVLNFNDLPAVVNIDGQLHSLEPNSILDV